jgi:hypothetical protein
VTGQEAHGEFDSSPNLGKRRSHPRLLPLG